MITIIDHHQKFSTIINNNSNLIIIIIIDLHNHHIIESASSFASCFKWWLRFGEDAVVAVAWVWVREVYVQVDIPWGSWFLFLILEFGMKLHRFRLKISILSCESAFFRILRPKDPGPE